MNKSWWINSLLLLVILGSSAFGIWDHWFKPKTILSPKLKSIATDLTPVPVQPFSDLDMQAFTKLKLMHVTGDFMGGLKFAQELMAGTTIEPRFREWLARQLSPLLTSAAWVMIHGGNCEEALKLLYKAQLNGPIAETKKGLGFCLHDLKNWPEAASWLSRYILDKPTDAEGRLLYADALESLGRYDEAVTILEGATASQELTGDELNAMNQRLQAMKVKAREGVRQKNEFSRRFQVSYREEEHEPLLAAMFETLESSLDEFSEILGVESSQAAIEVVLYRHEAFHDVIPGGPEWSEGVFDGRIRVPISAKMVQNPSGTLTTILRHELSHALVSQRVAARGLPAWFDEGLAQYLSCRRRTCAGFRFGVSPGVFLEPTLLSSPFVTLSTMDAGIAYQQSLYLFRWIVANKGEEVLKQMLRDLPTAGTLSSDHFVRSIGFESFAAMTQQGKDLWQRKVVF